jgi:hypothetical protein
MDVALAISEPHSIQHESIHPICRTWYVLGWIKMSTGKDLEIGVDLHFQFMHNLCLICTYEEIIRTQSQPLYHHWHLDSGYRATPVQLFM